MSKEQGEVKENRMRGITFASSELEFLSDAEEELLSQISDPETWVQNPVDREGMLFDWVHRIARAYLMTGRDRNSVDVEIPQLLSIIEGWLSDDELSYRAVEEEDKAEVVKGLLIKIRGTGGVNMPVGTAFSKDEELVLEAAKDLLDDGQGGARALREWAFDAFRSYLAAGCYEGAIVDRIPQLREVFVGHLRYTREGLQNVADDPDFDAADREEDRRGVTVAGELIERMRNRTTSPA